MWAWLLALAIAVHAVPTGATGTQELVVSAVEPWYGSVNGGERINITGNFLDDAIAADVGNLEVTIGVFPCYDPERLSSSLITCETAFVTHMDQGVHQVKVRMSTLESSDEVFFHYNATTLHYIQPPGILADQVTLVTIHGALFNFLDATSVATTSCQLASDGAFEPEASNDVVACTVVSVSGDQIACEMPAMPSGSYEVRCSLDSQQTWVYGSTELVAIRYFDPFVITGVEPRFGPASGGTMIEVQGTGFAAMANAVVHCKFNDTIVQAASFSSTVVSCKTPEFEVGASTVQVAVNSGTTLADFGSTSVVFYFLNQPSFSTVSTSKGPTGGETALELTAFLTNTPVSQVTALADLLTSFRFGLDAYVSPSGETYAELSFAGIQVPYTLTRTEQQYVQAVSQTAYTLDGGSGDNYTIVFSLVSPSHPAGTVPIAFSWDLQNFHDTGLEFRYLCESYTDLETCVSDPQCGWCATVGAESAGVCVELDADAPSDYVSALQSSEQTTVAVGTSACSSGYGWNYAVTFDEYPRYESDTQTLLKGASRLFQLYFPTKYKRSRIFILAEESEAYSPRHEAQINSDVVTDFTETTGYSLLSVDRDFVCGSLCAYIDDYTTTAAEGTALPSTPEISLTRLTSSSAHFEFAWANDTVDPTITAVSVQASTDTSFVWGVGSADIEFWLSDLSGGAGVAVIGLRPSTFYYFRVATQNNAGSSYGEWINGTTPAISAPSVFAPDCSENTVAMSPNRAGIVNEFAPVECSFMAHGQSLTSLKLLVYNASGDLLRTLRVGQAQNATSRVVSMLPPNSQFTFQLEATNAAGSALSTTTNLTTGALVGSIQVFGNNVEIVNGSSSTRVGDHTQFDEAFLGASDSIHVFLVKNTGNKEILFTGAELSDTANFAVVSQPLRRLPPLLETYVDVAFSPASVGAHGTTLTLVHSEGTFSFALSGEAVARSSDSSLTFLDVVQIRVLENSAAISGTFELTEYAVAEMEPEFNATVFDYTATIGADVDTLFLTVLTSDARANAELTYDGASVPVANLTARSSATLEATVIAHDGSNSTYTVTVSRLAAGVLQALSSTAGTLSPPFSSSQLSYTLTVDHSLLALQLSLTPSSATDTIAVNGEDQTGALSVLVAVAATGTTSVDVAVQSAAGDTTTYTLTIEKPGTASTDASLSSLAVSRGTLDPAFDPATLDYTLRVSSVASSVEITAVTTVSSATVAVNGVAASDKTATVSIDMDGQVVSVEVTAEDGTTIGDYTITVDSTVPISSDATLEFLEVSRQRLVTIVPDFDPSVLEYATLVDKTINVIDIVAVPTAATSVVSINGIELDAATNSARFGLPMDVSTFAVDVVAENGTTQRYTLSVTRVGYTTLSSLSTGLSANLELGSDLPSEVFAYSRFSAVPTTVVFDAATGERSSPYTMTINADGDRVSCVDDVGCDIAFVRVFGSNSHAFVASDSVGNDVFFSKEMLSVFSFVVVPEFIMYEFGCQGRFCPLALLGNAVLSESEDAIVLTQRAVANSEPQSSAAWLVTQPDLSGDFEFRFSFRVSDASLCAFPTYLYDTDAELLHSVDADSGLAAVRLSEPAMQTDAAGTLDPMPVFDTLVGYGGFEVGDAECERDGNGAGRIGGEGFAFVIHNAAAGSSSLGCGGTGVGYTADSEDGSGECASHVENSVVVQFDTYANVTKVPLRGRTDSVNASYTYRYEERNQIRVFELGPGSVSRPDPSATFPTPSNDLHFDDGNVHTMRVTFDSPELCVFVAVTPTKSDHEVDWKRLVCVSTETLAPGQVLNDDGTAFVGFTASTGVASQRVEIHSFEFCSVLGCGDRANRA